MNRGETTGLGTLKVCRFAVDVVEYVVPPPVLQGKNGSAMHFAGELTGPRSIGELLLQEKT